MWCLAIQKVRLENENSSTLEIVMLCLFVTSRHISVNKNLDNSLATFSSPQQWLLHHLTLSGGVKTSFVVEFLAPQRKRIRVLTDDLRKKYPFKLRERFICAVFTLSINVLIRNFWPRLVTDRHCSRIKGSPTEINVLTHLYCTYM